MGTWMRMCRYGAALLCLAAAVSGWPVPAEGGGLEDAAQGKMAWNLSAYVLPRREWSLGLGWLGNSYFYDVRLLELSYSAWRPVQFTSETGLWLLRAPNAGVKWAIVQRERFAVSVAGELFVYRPKGEAKTTLGITMLSSGGTYVPFRGFHLHSLLRYTALWGNVREGSSGREEGEDNDLLSESALSLAGLVLISAAEGWPADWLALVLEFRLPLHSQYKGTASGGAGTLARAETEVEVTEELPMADWTALAAVMLRLKAFRARLGAGYGPGLGGEFFMFHLAEGGIEKVEMEKAFFPVADIGVQW